MTDVPKAEPMPVVSYPLCPSVHKWSGQRCIRPLDHDGLCWGNSQRGESGTITRAEWRSVSGKFKSHHQYDTRYPANAPGGTQ